MQGKEDCCRLINFVGSFVYSVRAKRGYTRHMRMPYNPNSSSTKYFNLNATMTKLYLPVLFLLIYIQLAVANVEKVIFLGPSSVQIPTRHPTLEDLQLHTLSPQNKTVRTKLRAEFPTNTSVWGEASWVLLEQLAEGQRYEVRVCWAATVTTLYGAWHQLI